jgi:hypothetical protein
MLYCDFSTCVSNNEAFGHHFGLSGIASLIIVLYMSLPACAFCLHVHQLRLSLLFLFLCFSVTCVEVVRRSLSLFIYVYCVLFFLHLPSCFYAFTNAAPPFENVKNMGKMWFQVRNMAQQQKPDRLQKM